MPSATIYRTLKTSRSASYEHAVYACNEREPNSDGWVAASCPGSHKNGEVFTNPQDSAAGSWG